MMNRLIEEELRTWIDAMVHKYKWLNVRFEYSQKYQVWLVSFSPISRIEMEDEFNKEALVFADAMINKYGDDAPLFTDEEKLFKLSANAVSLNGENFTYHIDIDMGLYTFLNDLLYTLAPLRASENMSEYYDTTICPEYLLAA